MIGISLSLSKVVARSCAPAACSSQLPTEMLSSADAASVAAALRCIGFPLDCSATGADASKTPPLPKNAASCSSSNPFSLRKDCFAEPRNVRNMSTFASEIRLVSEFDGSPEVSSVSPVSSASSVPTLNKLVHSITSRDSARTPQAAMLAGITSASAGITGRTTVAHVSMPSATPLTTVLGSRRRSGNRSISVLFMDSRSGLKKTTNPVDCWDQSVTEKLSGPDAHKLRAQVMDDDEDINVCAY